MRRHHSEPTGPTGSLRAVSDLTQRSIFAVAASCRPARVRRGPARARRTFTRRDASRKLGHPSCSSTRALADSSNAPALLDRLLAEEASHPQALTTTGQVRDLLVHAKVQLFLLAGDARGAVAATVDAPPSPAVAVARCAALLAVNENHSVVALARDMQPIVVRHPRWDVDDPDSH
jgi:hypothetical protein